MPRDEIGAQVSVGDDETHPWSELLERPVSGTWCLIGWLCATAVFVALVALFGGPTYGDTGITIFSTWAVAHGDLACAYPPTDTYHFALASPLYPLLAGGVAAIFRIGHGVAFPNGAQLGAHCSHAFLAIDKWSNKASAWAPTMRIAYLSWFVLSAGIVTTIRASGRGRRMWEPAAVLLVAVTTPVVLCIVEWFHPQDVVAMGIALGGVACALRNRWLASGALLGLAYASQPFVILVVAVLIVLAPTTRRLIFGLGAIVTIALIAGPFVLATSGRALRSTLIGSNRVGTTNGSVGGTLLWETHLHGHMLFFVARILPVFIVLVVTFWCRRRLGAVALEPVPLLSLVAISLTIRLVFEVNFFGYYLMAVAVALVLLDVAVGRVRGELIAWIALSTLVFNPTQWIIRASGHTSGLVTYRAIPITMLTVVVIVILWLGLRGKVCWYLVAWTALVTTALLMGGWSHSPYGHPFSRWVWQVVFVSTAVYLAGEQLRTLQQRHRRMHHTVAVGGEIDQTDAAADSARRLQVHFKHHKE